MKSGTGGRHAPAGFGHRAAGPDGPADPLAGRRRARHHRRRRPRGCHAADCAARNRHPDGLGRVDHRHPRPRLGLAGDAFRVSRAAASSNGRWSCRWPSRPTSRPTPMSSFSISPARSSRPCAPLSAGRPSRITGSPRSRAPPVRPLCCPWCSIPYVYASCRAFFVMQSGSISAAARTLGAGGFRAFFSVTLPLSRPALVVGITLAMMGSGERSGRRAVFWRQQPHRGDLLHLDQPAPISAAPRNWR
jgi:hypothetical protein